MKIDKYRYKPISSKYRTVKWVRINDVKKLHNDYMDINWVKNVTTWFIRARLYKWWSIDKILNTPYLWRGWARNFKTNKKTWR